jgi:hypothetical protein
MGQPVVVENHPSAPAGDVAGFADYIRGETERWGEVLAPVAN